MSTQSKTPKYDEKVKVILDALEPGERTCSMTGEKWEMTGEEIRWYKKFNVPTSKVCPRVRWFHHGFWYVGYQFWYQKHPETGKPIISTVHPATGLKVLPDKEWFERDFTEQAIDYDPTQSFLKQFRKLQLTVPSPASRNHIQPKNSIVFVSQGDEDSFFVGASKSRRCLYSHICMDIEDSAEIYLSERVQNSFHVVHSDRIHNCRFVNESRDCMNSAFLFDCRNCENCFGATNKRNKKYLWFNEQISKEEWEKKSAETDFGSRSTTQELVRRFYAFMKEHAIWPENFNEQAENSTGEYLTRTTNVKHSYLGSPGVQNAYWCNMNVGNSENYNGPRYSDSHIRERLGHGTINVYEKEIHSKT